MLKRWKNHIINSKNQIFRSRIELRTPGAVSEHATVWPMDGCDVFKSRITLKGARTVGSTWARRWHAKTATSKIHNSKTAGHWHLKKNTVSYINLFYLSAKFEPDLRGTIGSLPLLGFQFRLAKISNPGYFSIVVTLMQIIELFSLLTKLCQIRTRKRCYKITHCLFTTFKIKNNSKSWKKWS